MRLCDVEFYLTRVETPDPAVCDRLVLVRVLTDTGVEGWGEAPLPWRVLELARRREQILPFLTGLNVLDIVDFANLSLPAPLRAAVEMACLDAAGKALRIPLCRFFGGFFRRQVPLGEFVGSLDDDCLLEKAQRWYDLGITWWIVGTSGQISRDVDVLKRIRERFGEAVQLRLDAAKRFDFTSAVHLCLNVQDLGVECVIDPLASRHWETFRRLRQEGPFRLAIRRGLRSLEELWSVCRCEAAQQVLLDLHELGGLLQLRDAVAVAHTAGLEVALSLELTTGLTLAAVLHLGAALPPLVHAHHFWGQWDERTREIGLSGKDGMWTVPEEPGLGVSMKRETWDTLSLPRDY